MGASIAAVHKMHETDNIRGVYFQNIIEASKRIHGDDAVTADDLCQLAARHLPRDKVEAA
ncbi:hypothetical protein [Roseobacter sp. TSBP12]|uniref:hypothetical protein n=1 Tax=Roseobacter sp. TSBP12 TaxID=1236613 RepID=UPI00125FABBE|nr:hypothetical protein [Roseobacter sp. TSBP12]